MAQEFIGDVLSLRTQESNGPLHVDRVPEDDGGHDEVETAGPVLLGFLRPVANAAQAMEADGAGQCVAGFAFVQLGRGLATKGRVFQPVQGEERPLDAADLPEGQASPFCRG